MTASHGILRYLMLCSPPVEPKCEHCWKTKDKCLCAEISPIEHRLQFVLLQHPQEAKKPEGTARLVSLSMPQMVHKVGLSWPSLKRLLGRDVSADKWAVLYAGSLKEMSKLKEEPYLFIAKKGQSIDDLEGVVVLDGNWKQAKTLWWRNPWLKKLNRLLLNPQEPSRYLTVRKQPRRNCLSTLESVATVLKTVEGNPTAANQLDELFGKHLALFQGKYLITAKTVNPSLTPEPAPTARPSVSKTRS